MAAFVGLLLALLLAALDETVVSTALPRIAADLHGFKDLPWVVTAYLLASTATIPLYGKLSDLYGRRHLLLLAITIFLAGSCLCALARNMTELAAFRALQGIGAGGLFAMILSAMGDLFSPRERGRYQGYVESVWVIAAIGGPLLGGVLTDQVSWRWIFWINVPLASLALLVVWARFRVRFVRGDDRIDYVGAAALTGAITCFLLLASWGGTRYAWGSTTIIAVAVAAIVFLGGFWLSARQASEPVLPLRLFRIHTVAVTNLAMFFLGATVTNG
jgi:MFS family permease